MKWFSKKIVQLFPIVKAKIGMRVIVELSNSRGRYGKFEAEIENIIKSNQPSKIPCLVKLTCKKILSGNKFLNNVYSIVLSEKGGWLCEENVVNHTIHSNYSYGEPLKTIDGRLIKTVL